MRLRTLRRDISRIWLAPCALWLLLDCGIARGPQPARDSESHFLGCTGESECSGIAGATCAGGWCVDVETGERIGMNALGNESWDALPPGSAAEAFPEDGEWMDGLGSGVGQPEASAVPPEAAPGSPCFTGSSGPAAPFRNQADLERLAGCESIYGDLEISFDADLRALSSLRNVFGTLYVHSAAGRPLSSLEGLENLQLVSGDLHLQNLGVASLASLSGLRSLGVEPEQGLIVEQSPRLRDLRGMNLGDLGSLTVRGLPALTSLEGVRLALTGRVVLQDVPALRSINLYGADSLTLDNTGFQNLVFLQGVSLRQLTVRNNPDFTDATVLAVEELIVDSNPQLTTLSLPAQAQPLISLEVVGNPSLQSIDGGEDLTWLRALSVRDNPLLQTINLPWVQSLGTFQVIRNPSLSSIELPLLTQQVDDLTVVSNPSLSLPSIFSITGRARKYKLAGNQGEPLFLDPCPYVRDNFCDEPPVDSICAPGTDRYDCEDRLP